MKYIDNQLPMRIAAALKQLDYNFEAFVNWFFTYVTVESLCRMATTMHNDWGFSKDLCMRYILCNIFDQFVVGLIIEKTLSDQYETVQMYEYYDDFGTDLLVREDELDYKFGIDFVAKSSKGKLWAIQVKSVENFDDALRDFKNMSKTEDKIAKLKFSCKELTDDQGTHPIPVMCYVDRETMEVKFEKV